MGMNNYKNRSWYTKARVALWRPIRQFLASRNIYVVRGRQDRLQDTLVKIFKELGTDCVIDVGANTGQYVRILRHGVLWQGPIRSVEPVPPTFERLEQQNAQDSSWEGLNIACGDRAGHVQINHYPGSSDLDSIHSATAYGRERLDGLRASPTRYDVPVWRLDEVWGEFVPAEVRRAHLKIDTQGTDLDVLRGSDGILNHIISLQIKLPAKHVYSGMEPLGAAIDYILSLGFEAVAFYPVSRDRDGIRAVEFDGIFVRGEGSG